ncbi:hypothetical protein QFC20_007843 [Naganishia adeliensis]|uniref:Uncharacterized protein n=1 Tax=Naganishia adeliensis TaxID=92952 RepID=A0ACC2UW53_9TREE|nr:hypothetical protein QFC20_007843 [Naganishia adeliensis]
MATTEKVQQPAWQVPVPQTPEPKLKVWNSLTRTKNEFIPMHGKRVDWYNCGPTVYDAAHMGHARNYLTQDMIRRILRDYFGYEVNFVMNVTDIEDKIIIRAREQHLLAAYRESHPSLSDSLKSDVKEAWDAYFDAKLVKCLPEADKPTEGEALEAAFERLVKRDVENAVWSKDVRAKEEKFGLILGSLQSALTGLSQANDSTALIDSAKDILSWWLDKKQGHTVTDPAIFRSLAAYWEDSFFADMAKLRVLPPDIITRVSEYVPEIVAFVEKIIANGFAYEDNGNVWFDVGAFEGAKAKKGKAKEQGSTADEDWEHVYAKLQPWSKGNRELLEEGEGSLTTGRSGKRSSADFALWKSGKPGEPTWPSPWGPGRPGWHIECSVMASEILGQQMDVHSGGVDLMFPHHDNEIAQSEAYHDCRQWVNYFLHTGHLHIQGLKMSKSLKNFITVEQALETYTPRQLRLAFMNQLWSNKMDLTDGVRSGVENIEETFNNFFRNVKAKISDFESRNAPSDGLHYYDQPEKQLISDLQRAQAAFRAALCDSFNTPEALNVLVTLVSQTNVYLQARPRPQNISALGTTAEWITRMLRIFGLGEGQAVLQEGAIGWGEVTAESDAGVDREAVLMPYLRVLSSFRDEVRKLALKGANSKEILELCDRLRDNELVDLGVALDDQEDGNAMVKLAPAEELRRARDEKKAAAEAKLARKAAAAKEAEAKRMAKLEKGKVAQSEMYRPPNVAVGLYSEWDAEGVPTKDGEGAELSKAKSKKMKKDRDIQAKLHQEWLNEVNKNGAVV